MGGELAPFKIRQQALAEKAGSINRVGRLTLGPIILEFVRSCKLRLLLQVILHQASGEFAETRGACRNEGGCGGNRWTGPILNLKMAIARIVMVNLQRVHCMIRQSMIRQN